MRCEQPRAVRVAGDSERVQGNEGVLRIFREIPQAMKNPSDLSGPVM